MASSWGLSWGLAWGNSWGSISVAAAEGVTILQRHKVDKVLGRNAPTFSKQTYDKYRKKWREEAEEKVRLEAIRTKAEEARRRKEAAQLFAYATERAGARSTAWTQQQLALLFQEQLARIERDAALAQQLGLVSNLANHLNAIQAIPDASGIRYRQAIDRQQEEEEILELLMSDE